MKVVQLATGKWNYLKDDGTYLLDTHINYSWDFHEGFGKVRYYDNTYNLVNSECKLLLKTNVDNCCDFKNGFAYIKINDIWYYIDKECKFYSDDKVSFKELYNEYPNMISLLIEIIKEYTYYDVNDYFNI